jgi:hypothetical protein
MMIEAATERGCFFHTKFAAPGRKTGIRPSLYRALKEE